MNSSGIHCCPEIITSKTEIINYNDSNGSIVHVFLCDWTANRKRNKLIRSFRFFCFPQSFVMGLSHIECLSYGVDH